MKTVLKISVENFEIIVSEQQKSSVMGLQTIQETGLTWSVLENGAVRVFDTFVYSKSVYSPKEVARKGIHWIANLEKTSKLRFAKADELESKYL